MVQQIKYYRIGDSKIYHTFDRCPKLAQVKNGEAVEILDDEWVRLDRCKLCKSRDSRNKSNVILDAFTQLGRYSRGEIIETPYSYHIFVKNQTMLVIEKSTGIWRFEL